MTAGYLVDTNVVSELRKGKRADASVRAWFEEHVAEQLWLSVLVTRSTADVARTGVAMVNPFAAPDTTD